MGWLFASAAIRLKLRSTTEFGHTPMTPQPPASRRSELSEHAAPGALVELDERPAPTAAVLDHPSAFFPAHERPERAIV
jgi:hypothetical protein